MESIAPSEYEKDTAKKAKNIEVVGRITPIGVESSLDQIPRANPFNYEML